MLRNTERVMLGTSSPQLMSFSVVVERVEGHLEDLVGLSESVPGPVVPFVHFNCMSKRQEQEKYYIYLFQCIYYLFNSHIIYIYCYDRTIFG